MHKTILVTGSTDGIGLETAKLLVSQNNNVLLHGRNPAKLEKVEKMLTMQHGKGRIESFVADLSCMDDVEIFAKAIVERHDKIEVLINNAGVYNATDSITPDGLDERFAVNAIAPFLLTQRLLPLLGTSGRVINLSSAAQSPVNIEVLSGQIRVSDDYTAYVQSKLALTMWSHVVTLDKAFNCREGLYFVQKVTNQM